jgi:hypothetical protein
MAKSLDELRADGLEKSKAVAKPQGAGDIITRYGPEYAEALFVELWQRIETLEARVVALEGGS